MSTTISGREPYLSSTYSKKKHWRLSLRDLASKLSLLPPDQISPEVAEAALNHPEFYVRYNAAESLSRRGDRNARLILQQALQGGSPPTRASSARVLHRFSWYAAEPLINHALNDKDARVREAAVYALCDFRHANAYQKLAPALANEVDDILTAATWGLRDHHHPACVPVLEMVLKSKDYDIRNQALEVLGMNDIPQAIPVVKVFALKDPHPEVNYAATLSFLELTEAKGIPELCQMVEETSGEQRAFILRAIFHATNYLKIDLTADDLRIPMLIALKQALKDPLAHTRMAVAWILAWIWHPDAQRILKDFYMNETDIDVKAHTLYVSFNLMSPLRDELMASARKSDISLLQEMVTYIEQTQSDGGTASTFTEGGVSEKIIEWLGWGNYQGKGNVPQ